MFKRTCAILAFAAATLLSSTLPAWGSDFGEIRVNVPFSFRAGSVTLPAGTYSFVRENPAGLLRIAGRGHSVMLISHPGASLATFGDPSVGFRKIGGTEVLEQLRLDGYSSAIVSMAELH